MNAHTLKATTIDGFCAACGEPIMASFGAHPAFEVRGYTRMSRYGTRRYRVHLHPACDTLEARGRIASEAAAWARWRERGV